MLQLEHMQRQRRDDRRQKRPLLTLAAHQEPTAPPLPPAETPESLPLVGYAERDPKNPAFAPAQPDSLGDSNALRNIN